MKKYLIMIMLLVITLTCVSATNDTSSDVIVDSSSNIDTSSIDSNANLQQDAIHHVNTSDNMHDVITDANNIQSGNNYTIELEDDLTIDEEIDNEYLNLVINGNNHQLTVNNLKFTNANNIMINNIVLELNNHIESYVDLNLNNVTVKSTKLYDNITKALSDNGITEFTDENYNRTCEIFYGINTNHGNIHNYKNLYVNNSIFTKTMAYTGSAIYNHGYLSVDNTIFNDTLSICGVVYSEESLRVTNSKFINNIQCAYLLHSDTGDITCINNSFENNYALYNSGVSSSGNTMVENCNFINNTASSMNSINNDGNMTVVNCNFMDNTGEVVNNWGNLTVTDSIFDNNTDMNVISNNYLYNSETDEIIRIGNMTLLNNTFLDNDCDKLIYNGVSITLLNNTFHNISDVLDQIEPGQWLFDGIISDTNNNMFNRSIHVESNTFIMDSQGVTDEVIIKNNTNYVQHTQKYSLILLADIENKTIGESIIISGYLMDAEGNPMFDDVKINISNYGETIESTDSAGFFSYECSPNVGVYNVTVTYDNNPYIIPYTITASFTVNELVEEEDNQTDDSEDSNSTDDNLSYENDTTSDLNITDVNETPQLVNNTDMPSNVNITDVNITDQDVSSNSTNITEDNLDIDDSKQTNNITNITDMNDVTDNLNQTFTNDYYNNLDNDDTNGYFNNHNMVGLQNQNPNIQNNNSADLTTDNKNVVKNINKLIQKSNVSQNNEKTVNKENNPVQEDNNSSITDNSTSSDTNNPDNNQPNGNQFNIIIPVAMAVLAVIVLIGTIILKP